MIILGIDPGFSRLGYAVIDTNKDNSRLSIVLVLRRVRDWNTAKDWFWWQRKSKN